MISNLEAFEKGDCITYTMDNEGMEVIVIKPMAYNEIARDCKSVYLEGVFTVKDLKKLLFLMDIGRGP